MNKLFITLMLLVATLILSTSSCNKSDDNNTNTNGTRSASFKIGSIAYMVEKPYIGIFDDAGTIHNSMTLTATDGSKIVINFIGNTPANYTLQSYSDAYYKNASGKQFNSTSGELKVTGYTTTDAIYKATGTFHFKATAISAPFDSLEITEGVFTNASNEL